MKFSIIVPVYNSGEYLRKTLDSLCSQKYEDYEIICIDDGSTDNSLSILNEYRNKCSNIIILSQSNSGPSASRNKGLKYAKGEYILFCASDDWLERDTVLNELFEYICKQNKLVDVVYFPGNTNWGGNTSVSPNFVEKSYETGWELCSNNCLIDSFLFFGSACAFCYRREVIFKFSIFFENRLMCGEDRLFVFDFLDKAQYSIVYSKPCYFYNIRPNSIMTNSAINTRKANDNITLSESMWNRQWQNRKQYIANFYLVSIDNIFRLGHDCNIKYKFCLLYYATTFKRFIRSVILILSVSLYKRIFVRNEL